MKTDRRLQAHLLPGWHSYEGVESVDLTVEQRSKLAMSQVIEAVGLVQDNKLFTVPALLIEVLVHVELLGSLAVAWDKHCHGVSEQGLWSEHDTDTSWGDPLDNPYLKSVAECWDEVEE